MIQISNEPMVRLKNGAYIPAKSYEGDMETARGNRTGCRKAIFAGKLTFSSMKEIYAGEV